MEGLDGELATRKRSLIDEVKKSDEFQSCKGGESHFAAAQNLRLRSGVQENRSVCYLAAQVIIVSTIFGTKNSITEPPRFLPMASMSPPLNFIAAIPIGISW